MPGAAVRVANEKSEWDPNPDLGLIGGLYAYPLGLNIRVLRNRFPNPGGIFSAFACGPDLAERFCEVSGKGGYLATRIAPRIVAPNALIATRD